MKIGALVNFGVGRIVGLSVGWYVGSNVGKLLGFGADVGRAEGYVESWANIS